MVQRKLRASILSETEVSIGGIEVKRVTVFALVAVVFNLLLCGKVFAADKKPEIKWRFAIPWTRPVLQKAFDQFSTQVKAESDGRIEIKVFPDGLLGSHDETFKGVQQGDIEMAMLVPYANLVPGGVINFMPWTVSNYDEFKIAFSSPDGILHQVMSKAYDDVNMKVVFSISGGGYGLGNNVREIRTPADLKNLKMRVSASMGMVKALGNMGKGTGMSMETIPWSELYNALSRKVINGCWTTTNLLVAERQYEVMKYYTDLGFAWDAAQVVVNKQAWAGLPTDLRSIIEKAAKSAEIYALELQKNALAEDMRTLKTKGLTVYVPTPAETDAFIKISGVEEIWKEQVTPWMDKAFPGKGMTQVLQVELARIRAEVAGRK